MKDFTNRKAGKYNVRTWRNGAESCFFNGRAHREDAPALKYSDGRKYWFLDGKQYSKEDWKVEIRRRKFRALGI